MEDYPDPSIITKLATGYWSSMVLIAANRLNVFSHLNDGPLSAHDLAARCDSHPRSLEMLLNACVAERLLVKDGSLYANSATARLFLVRGSRAFLGDALKYTEDLYPVWGRLEEAVRSNEPALQAEDYLGSDREKTRNFVYGMHNRALGIAAAVVAGINLEGRRQLFDVGAGPGTYSILLAQKTPGLRCTVFDLPPVVEISREIVAGYGLSERITCRPGNYLTDAFAQGNDVVLMSGMMHREEEDTCRNLLSKAFESLEAGGTVIVSDVMFDDDSKTSPQLSALFALNMMLTSQAGSTHAQTAFIRWMSEARFTDLKVGRLAPPMSHIASIEGRKPL
jgi:predicted O-methyltransferase YrrM